MFMKNDQLLFNVSMLLNHDFNFILQKHRNKLGDLEASEQIFTNWLGMRSVVHKKTVVKCQMTKLCLLDR